MSRPVAWYWRVPPNRTDRAAMWRRIAATRRAAGDRQAAANATRCARLTASPLKSFCFGCGDLHEWSRGHDCDGCIRRQEARRPWFPPRKDAA